MSNDSVVHGILESNRLEQWAKTFHSKGSGKDAPILGEVKAHFSGDGVNVRAVDPANVAAFEETTLAPRAFEEFDSPGQVTVGVNLERLIDYLRPAGGSTLVELNVNMETRHLELRYGETSVSVALIDPDSMRNEPGEPDLDLPNEFVLTGEQLSHAVTVADMVGDHITIRCDPDERHVKFYSRGDTDDVTVTYGDDELIDARVTDASESIYSVDYLDSFAKVIPDDAEVHVRNGEESPLRLRWETFDGGFEVGQMLAPRIQSR